MRQFEVSERSIRSDLAFLRDRFGAPLVYNKQHGGYTYSDPNWKLSTVLMSEGELLAFFLSIEVARRYLGTAFELPLREAVEKIATNLPDEIKVDLSQLAAHYSFGTAGTIVTNASLLLDLQHAIREQHPLDVTYFTPSRNALTERTFHPYHLHNARGDWQLIAFDTYRGRVLTFLVDRIRQWKIRRSERFEWLEGFSLDAYLASQFVAERIDTPITYVIWFDAYQAHYIRERHWHATQEPLEEHPDGSVTMRITAGSMAEIQRWVLGFGAHARVISPQALADAVQSELQAALQLYSQPPTQ